MDKNIKQRMIALTLQVTGQGEPPSDDQLDAYMAQPLSDLGIDSLSALELAVHLERELGARLEEDELAEVQTLADIAAVIDEKLQ
ncbi:acyl carrier protein [Marinicrinis sediminis]|uniref:Acyl carrier protein n=1 Tax=Marinicrinis sediminis TaxID=1652465 RepID=A0ABW5RFV0_9BACL